MIRVWAVALLVFGALTARGQETRRPNISYLLNPTVSQSYGGVVGSNYYRLSGGRLNEVFQMANGHIFSLFTFRNDAHPNRGTYLGSYSPGEDQSFHAWHVAGASDGNDLGRFSFIIGSAEDNEWHLRDGYIWHKHPNYAATEAIILYAGTDDTRHIGTNDTVGTSLDGARVELEVSGVSAAAVGQFWRQTSTRVITNTTTATTFFGTGTGTTNLPAGFLNVEAGRTIVVDFMGRYSTAGTPGTFTIDVALGGTTVVSTGAVTPVASQTEKLFHLQVRFTVRTVGSSGTIQAVGRFDMHSATSTLSTFPMLNSTTTTHDMTTALALHVRGTMSATTAPNNLQIQVGGVYIE
jgi:hypothetical protein